MENQSEQEIRDRIRTIILEMAPNPEAANGGDAHLMDELEFHSLALIELAFALEDEFELQAIDAATAEQIRTIHDVQEHVVAELRERVTPAQVETTVSA